MPANQSNAAGNNKSSVAGPTVHGRPGRSRSDARHAPRAPGTVRTGTASTPPEPVPALVHAHTDRSTDRRLAHPWEPAPAAPSHDTQTDVRTSPEGQRSVSA